MWTELYDIEHETAGIYAFDRTAKDDGGNPPSETNAVTVAIPDVTPLAPGCDFVARDGVCRVRRADLAPRPGAGRGDRRAGLGSGVAAVRRRHRPAQALDGSSGQTAKVQPFRLSEPLRISERIPSGVDVARLHVVLVCAGEVVGHTSVDAATRPVGRTAIDGNPSAR